MYLPFYVLRYEKGLETIDKDRKRLDELLREYTGICSKLYSHLKELSL